MAKVITLGLQKGGVSKTTTTGILAHLLSNEGNILLNSNEQNSRINHSRKRVLAVDMDSQGNLTELLTEQPANNFFDRSVFEAIAYKDPEKYIYKVDDYLHVLPANNFLASFSRWIYTKWLPHTEKGEIKVDYDGLLNEQLKLTLDLVKDQYDYILIDTPPALSEQTTNALVASDYVIVLFEASKFCYSAVPNFLETVYNAQNFVDLEVLGILRTLSDARRKDVHFFNDLISKEYPELIFETVITRKASTGRLPLYGFDEVDNRELEDALSQFNHFYKELLMRLEESDRNE